MASFCTFLRARQPISCFYARYRGFRLSVLGSFLARARGRLGFRHPLLQSRNALHAQIESTSQKKDRQARRDTPSEELYPGAQNTFAFRAGILLGWTLKKPLLGQFISCRWDAHFQIDQFLKILLRKFCAFL